MGSVTANLLEKVTGDVGVVGTRPVTGFLFLRDHPGT
jgi:hypothetical protein